MVFTRFCDLWFSVFFENVSCFERTCLAKMSTCNQHISHQSDSNILVLIDSHTEVHQPSSISKSTTSHHTTSGHHLYEGDLVSKTSNLNQSSISGAWAWASLGGGGRQKKTKTLVVQFQEQFFSAPPALEKPRPRPHLLEIEDSLPIPRAGSGPGARDSQDY